MPIEKNKKIAVVHDHLGFAGGGERTALSIAIGLDADFICAFKNNSTFPDYQSKLADKLICLADRTIDIRGFRFFYTRYIFWKNRKILKNYDILISSGQPSTEAVAFYPPKTTKKIVYTHSQPRRVFDLYEISKKSYPLYLRPFFIILTKIWKRIYLSAIKKYDINIANSENVKARALKYTGRDVDHVVWPPILTEKFKWISDGDYFLSWGRCDEAKRIELIVKAFQKMPDKKLKVASGGPRLEIVKELAKGHDNIEVLGWVSDDELFSLVGSCQAAIYIPIQEDAGMTQLEANAAGKAVLGVAEGGLRETIVDQETGILIKENPELEDIVNAVNLMTSDWCKTKKDRCIEHAKAYSEEKFIEKIKKIVF